jgi:hypothetical protein
LVDVDETEINYINEDTLKPFPDLNIRLCGNPIVQFDFLSNMRNITEVWYKPKLEGMMVPMSFGQVIPGQGIFVVPLYGVMIYKNGRLIEWNKYGNQNYAHGLYKSHLGKKIFQPRMGKCLINDIIIFTFL